MLVAGFLSCRPVRGLVWAVREGTVSRYSLQTSHSCTVAGGSVHLTLFFFKKQFHDGTYFPPPHRLSDPLLGTAGIHASVVGGQHSSGVQTPPAIRGGRLAVLKLVLWGCSMYMGLVNRTHSPAAAEGSVAPADIQIIIKRLFRRTTLLWHRSRHILYVHYDE